MIRDWLGGLALLLLRGPVLLCLGLIGLLLAVLGGYGWGRRAAFREIDEKRAEVAAAIERELAARACGMIPGQRNGGEW